jgi:hypothetical protein
MIRPAATAARKHAQAYTVDSREGRGDRKIGRRVGFA